jgi:hypothetical protein
MAKKTVVRTAKGKTQEKGRAPAKPAEPEKRENPVSPGSAGHY